MPRAREASAADSLMLARGAMWNPSIFRVGRGEPMVAQAEVFARFVDLAEQTECPFIPNV